MAYGTVIEVINSVHKKLHIDTVSDVDDTVFSELCLDALNLVVHDICYAGNLVDRRKTGTFTISNTGIVKVSAADGVHHIEDVYHGESYLNYEEPHDLRRMFKTSSSNTTPNQYTIVSSSAGVADIQVWGVPTTANETLDICYYAEPHMYTSAEPTAVVPYDFATVAQGVYARMLLLESGGQPTQEFQTEFSLYKDKRDRSFTKHTYESGYGMSYRY